MTDDLDRNLMRAFAVESTPLPDDDFIRRLMLRVARRRRSQVALRLVPIVPLFLVGAFATHVGELLTSPLGWTLSLLVAGRDVAPLHSQLTWESTLLFSGAFDFYECMTSDYGVGCDQNAAIDTESHQ